VKLHQQVKLWKGQRVSSDFAWNHYMLLVFWLYLDFVHVAQCVVALIYVIKRREKERMSFNLSAMKLMVPPMWMKWMAFKCNTFKITMDIVSKITLCDIAAFYIK